tara:strand:- start:1532 stop:2014 length:483 start_codon:yes stop_codon:yes gene_type:complete
MKYTHKKRNDITQTNRVIQRKKNHPISNFSMVTKGKMSLLKQTSMRLKISENTLRAKMVSYLNAVEQYKKDTYMDIPGYVRVGKNQCCSSQVTKSLSKWLIDCITCPPQDDSVFGHWLIDCGSSSVEIDCDTGNDAGYTDGGEFGNTGCVTRDMGCNQAA